MPTQTKERAQKDSWAKLDSINSALDTLDETYRKDRDVLKEELAEALIEANEVDIKVSEVASKFGKTRQALYRVIKDIYGIRHPDKARAGRLGHELRKRENV
jgi:mRNA-degrading endonuclease RelE of RelBE toxin-antitoxin system